MRVRNNQVQNFTIILPPCLLLPLLKYESGLAGFDQPYITDLFSCAQTHSKSSFLPNQLMVMVDM
jgi:hypothetical protein